MLHRKRNRALSLAVLALGLFSAAPVRAAVTPGGDTTVAASASQNTTVGKNQVGTLTIDDGSSLANNIGYLGYSAGATGAATVRGAGSTWASTGDLYVGKAGSGSLTVMDGGLVTARTLYGAASALHGNGTITVNGAILDADLVYDGPDAPAHAFGSGGTLNLALNGTSTLGVGYKGKGNLRIADGAAVASGNGHLGFGPGAEGTATVGAGGVWTASSLYIGQVGKGTLNIDPGGQVSSGSGWIGNQAGSSGAVTVRGPGAAWTNSDFLGVGQSGNGTLLIDAGAQVTSRQGSIAAGDGLPTPQSSATVTVTGAGSKWTNSQSLAVGIWGSALLAVKSGGNVTSGSSVVGRYGTGTVVVTGAGSEWTSSGIEFGFNQNSSGTLHVQSGGQVNSGTSRLGAGSGTTGTAIVSGTGSKWANSYDLYVGSNGSGSLTVEAGGQVTSAIAYIAFGANSSAAATVTGAGSTWSTGGASSSVGDLYVGGSGTGKLTVADGGKVTAKNLSVNNRSAVQLHVSGNGMVVLGTAASTGSVTSNGTISLFADAALGAGIYRPIAEYAGRAMTWSGTGSYKAVGGVWDNAARTFTVAEATALLAGNEETVTAGERLLVTDSLTGQRVGASFGSISGAVSFSAALMGDLASLAGLLEEGEGVLSAWDFTTNHSGSEVMLSFDVGMDREDLAVWHLEDGVWSAFTPGLFTYDANGIASFTVSSFSGYAVTAAGVPEPGMMGMTALAGAMMLVRRRRAASRVS